MDSYREQANKSDSRNKSVSTCSNRSKH